jgi:hypothetical protein
MRSTRRSNAIRGTQSTERAATGEHMPRVRTSIAGFALALSLLVGYVTYKQVQIAERSSHVQTWQYLGTQDTEITKLFVQYPELRPYFFSRKKLLPTDLIYEQVMAMADLHLTLMDSFDDDFVTMLPGMEQGGKYVVLWEEYFKGLFSKSSVLCSRYKESREVYAGNLSRYAEVACAVREDDG